MLFAFLLTATCIFIFVIRKSREILEDEKKERLRKKYSTYSAPQQNTVTQPGFSDKYTEERLKENTKLKAENKKLKTENTKLQKYIETLENRIVKLIDRLDDENKLDSPPPMQKPPTS